VSLTSSGKGKGKGRGKVGDDSGDCCGIKCSVVDPTNKFDDAPYVPHVAQGALGTKTMPVSAMHQNGVREYDAHSLYGFMESIATHEAVQVATGERPFILSRSTFPGSGVHTAHWTGDNAANWDNLAASITTMNTLSLFGMPMTGADICGFGDDTTSELCARWIEVGAFSPFSRNHNSINQMPQELYRWDIVAEASRSVLSLRYRLLPHLYTLMYRASSEGRTVMNGLWVHFPTDRDALAAEGQYMWADSVLFTPVLLEGATQVSGHFPEGVWYSLFDDSIITGPQSVTLDTPLTATNAHVRGGTVLPTQQYATTTAAVKRSPYTLVVAADANQEASGMLYQDDGVSVAEIRENPETYRVMKFDFADKTFTSTADNHGYSENNENIEQIEFWGVTGVSESCVAELNVADNVNSVAATFDSSSGKLTVVLGKDFVKISDDFKLTLSCA